MNKRNKLIGYLAICLIAINSTAKKPILLIGATAHIGNGEIIENSLISFKDDKFDIVSEANKIRIDPSAYDTIIKIHGKHIYPGFISPNNTLGITEIGAVRATNDYNEVGDFNPNVRSLTAYNTDSRILKTIRSNGVLITQVTPRGGIISGASSVMYLDGMNWEDASAVDNDGIHLNWPSAFKHSGWWAEPGNTKQNKSYETDVEKIKQYFKKAYAYFQFSEKIDLQMKSLENIFKGSSNLYIHANYAKEIRESIRFFSKIGVKNIVIVGGKEAINAINIIKEYKVPIILIRTHSLPRNEDSPIDEFYSLPSKLHEEGIIFCFSYSGDMEAMGSRNLPFTAGTAVAYGLNKESAITALTLNAAKILGISEKEGSIEEGKNATFFISNGDALDMKTNQVEAAFIKGMEIDLYNHQKELYEKYRK